ncbi:glycosyltransferase family 1 protein [Patescibacteria group bacterium]|nr:MAG: glycosyltransferase family 1 protein [Patescibacteria group bacterium]
MKIAHVISTFPPRIGGMGKVCFEEAKELAKRGHDVTVFTLRYADTPSSVPPLRGGGINVVRMWPVVRAGDAGWAPQLFWKLKNFDIVHLHYPFYGGAHCVLLARLFRKQKYVLTYHMDARPAGLLKKFFQKIYDFIFAKAILRNAEKMIVMDRKYFEASTNTTVGSIVPDSVRTVEPNAGTLAPQPRRKVGDYGASVIEIAPGVDAEIYQPSGGWPQGGHFGAGKKTILFAANPMPLKRLDLLLKALRLMNEDVSLLVVGGGYALEDYKKMAEELGIKNKVVFAGRCDSEQKMAEYYNSASCLAIPSQSESFSLSAIEAMACGCPVVARDMPAMAGRVTHGVDGWLVNSDKPEDWARVLREAVGLTAEERERIGAAGRKKVVENYDWNRHVDELEKVYSMDSGSRPE